MDSFILKGKIHTYLVYRFIYEPVASNMYVVLRGNEAVIVDPHESDALIALLKQRHICMVNIILTHEHFDHTSGLRWLCDLYPSTIYCQKSCAATIAVKRENNPSLIALVLANKDKVDGGSRYADFRQNFKQYSCKADYTFQNEVLWNIAGIEVRGISTPGHSPGSAFYYIDDVLAFSGDTMLRDVPVVTRLRSSSHIDYEQKTVPYLKSLNPELILIPGHGTPFKVKDAQYI